MRRKVSWNKKRKKRVDVYFLLRYISAAAIAITAIIDNTIITAYRYSDGTPLLVVVVPTGANTGADSRKCSRFRKLAIAGYR
jgi:hypothetical protein